MANGQLSEMTPEELEHMQQVINQERQQLKTQALEIQQEFDRRAVAHRAQEALAKMSDAEKALIHQVLSAGGIPSEEKVAIPGE